MPIVDTSAKPIIIAPAVVVVRLGERAAFSEESLPATRETKRIGQPIALARLAAKSGLSKIGKVGRPIKLTIGLLCSKSFDDSLFDELFWVKYGLRKQDVKKMNVKGVLQVWMRNGDYHEISLKECHAWTREGCDMCPDFAAEHADISTGGIGEGNDWTLTIVRSDLGRAIITAMLEDGVIEGKPGDSDPGALKLLHKLAQKSRDRWPKWAAEEVQVQVAG